MNKNQIKKITPGLLLSLGVAILSKILAIFIPKLGATTIAILLGIILGNTIFRQKELDAGTKFSESKLLEVSVVLLGATVSFQTIAQMGPKALIYILLLMTSTIAFIAWLGRKIGFNKQMSLMMAGGCGVCGSSAIASIAPTINADDEEKGQVITLVNLLGTVMMLTLPFLAKLLFPDQIMAQSALLGGTLQSVGQVVAGASFLGESVIQMSMLFKIMRIIMLTVVVLVMGRLVKNESNIETQNVNGNKKKLIPWYVLGFLLVCTLNSLLPLPEFLASSAKFISGWFETIALAAIGLRLDLQKFIKEGPKFLIYGLTSGLFQTVMSLILIYLLIK